MATKARNGAYIARCSDCPFTARGKEAFCHRKGAFHARKSGHHIVVGIEVENND